MAQTTTPISDRLDKVGRPYNSIERKLAVYGRAECPICGEFRETIYARTDEAPHTLACRNHPGHPLYRF